MQAAQALKKAATFYRGKVASHGGYVYYYSVDLQQRWGEGKASPSTIFVQPPGTPTARGAWNVSSLDDGQTQAALQFLIEADRDLHFKHAGIHKAAAYGLAALLKAQFPNGGFPQAWSKPVEAKPVLKASYPDYDWKTQGKIKNYWGGAQRGRGPYCRPPGLFVT